MATRALQLAFLAVFIGSLASCGEQADVDSFVGDWYGGSGTHETHFYRAKIRLLDEPAEYEVRDIDELNKPWVSANPLERLKLIGFEVEGGVPVSIHWATPEQTDLEVLAESFFLPRHEAVVDGRVLSQLSGAVTGRGLSAPLFYDTQNDRLVSSPFLPCFYRTIEEATARSAECTL